MNSDKYIHSEVEDNIYSYWEKNELFKPKKNTKKFSIVIPPPNVTGSLHMGHALNNSIQDLLTRYYRMNLSLMATRYRSRRYSYTGTCRKKIRKRKFK